MCVTSSLIMKQQSGMYAILLAEPLRTLAIHRHFYQPKIVFSPKVIRTSKTIITLIIL
ncbi:hypothetical protein [Sporosarcina pasteurii]|uniref:hypothetical protein n=1 Tax=Sporosarcina pasteurii TaxID=1474 RepID=UPI00141A311A|nr:hypothetical protein [Sporosarcina pasteurii]MDS9470906.1 hypothetical protein [Sporosarcina pasteurii]